METLSQREDAARYMTPKKTLALLSATATLVGAFCAHAQASAELYQVEMIIVKHADAEIESLRDVANPELAHRLRQPALALADATPADAIFAVTDETRYRLTRQARRIRDDGSLTIVRHLAWRQPPYSRGQARYVHFLREPKDGVLKGVAWLSYENYFQLRLDFQYDPAYSEEPSVTPQPTTTLIPIHMKKILGANELHYLDHPIIGVLVQITPVR